ncbi:16S rRNA (cytidine(1402)-2'-O)-methyltransferase [bacterium]|nr:16S rRNA (cytidine(1402)-2'-O)-methyltransferase [bacterium]
MRKGPGTLYIVSLPIGNLSDMSFRAVQTLKAVSAIFCEDTRSIKKIFSRFGFTNKAVSLHSYNEEKRADDVFEILSDGGSVALVSEAGTPAISDPGALIVREAIKQGFNIEYIPGPSAVIAGIVLSGFLQKDFYFAGYAPSTGKMRRRFLRSLDSFRCPVVVYESPHRLLKLFQDVMDILGDVPMFVGRELTKKFEERFYGTVSEAVEHFSADKLLGEFVIVFDLTRRKD